MNLYIRVLILFIRSFFKPKINEIKDSSIVHLHVWPNDLDTNGHMNNGRYPTIMDLGRLDLILRNGLMKVMFKQKCVPVLGSIQMRFRLPLMPFQAYELHTRVLCWDQKWVYMEQQFIIKKGQKAGAVAAIGLIKGGFYNKNTRSTVPTEELLKVMGMEPQSPNFPEYINDWIAAEESLKAVTSNI